MKKFFKMLVCVLCIIPCLFMFTACGKDDGKGDGQPTVLEQGFNTIKAIANKNTKIVEGRTYNHNSKSKMVMNYDTTGLDENLAKELNKQAGEIKSENISLLGFSQDGEGIYRTKSLSSFEEGWEIRETAIKKENINGTQKYVKYDYSKDSKREETQAVIVGDDYVKVVFPENDDFMLTSGEFLADFKDCENIEEMKQKLSNLASEVNLDEEVLDRTKFSGTLDITKENDKFKLIGGMSYTNLQIEDEKTQTTSTANVIGSVEVVFDTNEIISYKIKIDFSVVGKYNVSMTDTPKLINATSTISMESQENIQSTFDKSELNRDYLSLVDSTDISLASVSVNVYLNGTTYCFSSTDAYAKYGDDINVATLLEQCQPRYDFANCAIAKLYLDKDMTKEVTADNLKKYPSYDLKLYAKLVPNDGYAVVNMTITQLYRDGSLSYTYQKVFEVQKGAEGLDFSSWLNANYYKVQSISVDGVAVANTTTKLDVPAEEEGSDIKTPSLYNLNIVLMELPEDQKNYDY